MSSKSIYRDISTISEKFQQELQWYSQKVPPETPLIKTIQDLKETLQHIHGDKYDYSNITWDGKLESKITIKCKKHGDFSSKVSSLTRKNPKTGRVNQCPECTKEVRRLRGLISGCERIFNSHGSKFKFGGFLGDRLLTSKINVFCTEHGSETTVGFDRIHKYTPCPSCNGVVSSAEDFLNTISETIKERLSFDEMTFVDRATPILVRCKRHDHRYYIKPHLLYGGTLTSKSDSLGCPICKSEVRNSNFDDFYNKAIKIHGDKFIYDSESFKGLTHKNFIVTCKEHGRVFSVVPRQHILAKYGGCPDCEKANRGSKRRKTKEEFIQQARKTHGDRFSYDKVNYKSGKDKVVIICPDHGDFSQRPNDHIRGDGCPTCGGYSFWESKIDTTLEASIYLMILQSHDEQFIKIGVSQHPEKRATQIGHDTRGHYNVSLISHIRGNANEVHEVERFVHNMLKDKKYKPRIKFGGYSECFEFEEISWVSEVFLYHEEEGA